MTDDDILSDAPSEVSLANVDDNDDFSEDDGRSIQAPVESLVAGRERRSTAGNRLATLLHQEADAEDTLFLEDEDDVEFAAEEAEELSDVQLDFSSEDEYDAGPPAVDGKDGEERDEELEGERELERQVKEAKAVKKRKAAEAFLKPRISTRKRVTIKDVTSTTTTATTTAAQTATATMNSPPRPRKKSERVSWIPEFAAVRSSSRTLSLQNRTETMKRLEESEKRRLHTIKLMEAAAAKKDKTNPRKVMTQADRLREAKLTEEMNLKSLNRWEQNEAYRLEEQRKKLAALQNRRLVGPVITWWSGTAEWDEEGRLVKVGKGLADTIQCASNEEGKKDKDKDCKRKFKSRSSNQEKGKEKATSESEGNLEQERNEMQQHGTIIIPQPEQDSVIHSPQLCSTSPSRPTSSTSDNINPAPSSDTAPLAPPPPAPQPQVIRNNGVLPMFLEGILEYATLPDPSEQKGPPPEKSTDESTPPTPPSMAERPKPKTEQSTRNVVVLGNFDPPAVQAREGVAKVLFPSESKRSWPTHKPLCVITHKLAKFRDPATGMPYASLQAYREVQNILQGEIQWSCLLGAYIGTPNMAAKGVPDGFLKSETEGVFVE